MLLCGGGVSITNIVKPGSVDGEEVDDQHEFSRCRWLPSRYGWSPSRCRWSPSRCRWSPSRCSPPANLHPLSISKTLGSFPGLNLLQVKVSTIFKKQLVGRIWDLVQGLHLQPACLGENVFQTRLVDGNYHLWGQLFDPQVIVIKQISRVNQRLQHQSNLSWIELVD